MVEASKPRPKRWLWWLLAVVLGGGWWTASQGLVSSNDGSHLALARALALRGQTHIDAEVALTLWVDKARRGEHDYSDRPPGTAFAALPAVWVGHRLDAPLLEHARQARKVVVSPAAHRYIQTYGARVMKLNVVAPPLAGLQGTAFMVKAHTVVLGLAGLAIAVALLRRRGVGSWGQLFAAATLGACTLWGPYATVLFSHVTAGVAVGAMILAAESMTDTSSPRHRIALGLAAGLAGAWAVATEYALLPVVVLLPLLLIRLRDWPWIALGAAPMVAMTLAYHYAAFGSPWSIGYDFHTNFEFARERTTTFRGDPLEGAWMLWGLGRGAGVLALSPIVLVGIVGLLQTGPTRRWLLALTPFFGLLAFHQTPWGGASNDHRYLVPALPLVAVGLGLLWDRLAPGGDRRALLWRVILLTLAAASGWLGWLHFLAGRDS